MKNPLMLLLIIFLLGGCSSQEENGNIIVSFEGIKEDTVFIASWPPFNQDDSKEQIDTVFIENGKLKYQLNINELNKVAIIPKSSGMVGGEMITSSANIINIWMDQNDEVRVNAKIDGNYIEYNTSGNAFSQQQSEARQMILPILKESHELRVKRQLVEEKNDSIQESLNKYSKQLWVEKLEKSLEYVEMHPDYEYSAWILFNVINTNDKEKVLDLYKILSDNVKNTYWGKKLANMVYGFEITMPGARFPMISGVSVNGNSINLNDYRGKYVIIDFWGSWCGPCIGELPSLKKYREVYKSRLEILGIACNDRLDKLKAVVQSEGIKWENLLSGTENENVDYIEKFQIHEYPTKVLLDTSGVVIQTFIGVDLQLYGKLDELLVK